MHNPSGRRGILYNSVIHKSQQEAWFHALHDLMGHTSEYEPHSFNFYIPDFYVDQHYGAPFYSEIKGHIYHTQGLAEYESKSYSRTGGTGAKILIFGAIPVIPVTDNRCCDVSTYEIAAISEPFHHDGCGSWIWATFDDGVILLLPHCGIEWPQGAQPIERDKLRQFWEQAKRQVKMYPYKAGDQLALDLQEPNVGASTEDPYIGTQTSGDDPS